MAAVARLAYLGLEVSQPDAWLRFATGVLGLEAGPRASDGALPLRLDDYAQRIRLHEGKSDDVAYIGWETADGGELAALVLRLKRAGVEVRSGTPAEIEARKVDALAVTKDPNGIRVELAQGPKRGDRPFRSPAVSSGFVTGEEGMGHVFLFVDDSEKTDAFYRELLGLRLSDYIDAKLGAVAMHAVFLHANPRHHSLAFTKAPMRKRLGHFMLEVNAVDDVGVAYDRCQDAGVPIRYGLGRHPNDRMISFYGVTPSGFAFELGWGGRKVEEASWQIKTYRNISDWGHRPMAGAQQH